MRRTETRPGRRPARPGQKEQARAHTRGIRAWRPPTRKGRCRRPHETAPVHRPSPLSKGGRYGKLDASVTGSTHVNNRSARSPRPKPEGPARDNPIAGPQKGMTRSERSALASAGASGRHKEPGSRPASTYPAQPPSKAGGDSPRGGERHHGDGKADQSTESNLTGRGAAHQRGATRHAREARRRPQPRHEDRCQAATATGCREPGKRAQHTTNRGTGEGAKDSRDPTPASPAPRTSGKRAPAARLKGREVGGGRAPVPGRPTPRQQVPLPGALVPPPQRAKPARKSARGGVGDGSPRPHPPHPQQVGSGPPPHARKNKWLGVGQRPTPDAPHPGERRPPRARSCRTNSAQSQLARARAVELVTGPHARTPRTHSQWVVGPSRTPERTSGRGWESARPRTPHTQARGAPPGHPQAAATARKASSSERALWGS